MRFWVSETLPPQVFQTFARNLLSFGSVTCGNPVSLPGIEPLFPDLEAQNLKHWATGEVPKGFDLHMRNGRLWKVIATHLENNRFYFAKSTEILGSDNGQHG